MSEPSRKGLRRASQMVPTDLWSRKVLTTPLDVTNDKTPPQAQESIAATSTGASAHGSPAK